MAFGPSGPGNSVLQTAGNRIAFNQRFNQRFNARFNQRFNQRYNVNQRGHGTGIVSGGDGGASGGGGLAPPRVPGASHPSGGAGLTPPRPPAPAAAPQAQPQPQVSAGTAQAQGSPLDATYFNNIANNQFKTNQSINSLNQQGAGARTNLQSTLAQLAYAQPRADLGLEQKYNGAGGLYSSVYDQNLGNLNYGYLGKQGAAESKYTDTMAQIASRIAGLQGGVPIYDQGQAIDSAARATNLAQRLPAPGATPGSPGAPRLSSQAFDRKFNAKFNQKLAAKGRRGRR